MVWSFGPAIGLEWAGTAVMVHVGSGVDAVSAASCAADLCALLPFPRGSTNRLPGVIR